MSQCLVEYEEKNKNIAMHDAYFSQFKILSYTFQNFEKVVIKGMLTYLEIKHGYVGSYFKENLPGKLRVLDWEVKKAFLRSWSCLCSEWFDSIWWCYTLSVQWSRIKGEKVIRRMYRVHITLHGNFFKKLCFLYSPKERHNWFKELSKGAVSLSPLFTFEFDHYPALLDYYAFETETFQLIWYAAFYFLEWNVLQRACCWLHYLLGIMWWFKL